MRLSANARSKDEAMMNREWMRYPCWNRKVLIAQNSFNATALVFFNGSSSYPIFSNQFFSKKASSFALACLIAVVFWLAHVDPLWHNRFYNFPNSAVYNLSSNYQQLLCMN